MRYLKALTTAIGAIPDNMASAVMATLNPVQGLYAGIIGTPVAALTTSSVFMLVNTTSAMALATLLLLKERAQPQPATTTR